MRTSDKKRILIEAALALCAIVAIIVIFIQLWGAGDDKIETTLALGATETEVVGVDAYVIRDESVIYSDVAGVAEYVASDGEKLPSGSLIANVYSVSGISAAELQSVIDGIDRTLAVLERSNTKGAMSYSDVRELSNSIDSLFSTVSGLSESGNLAGVRGLLDELLVMMSKYNGATGVGEDLSSEILSLRQRKSELIDTYKVSSQSATADKSGYFYRETDGYEGIFSADKLDSLTYESFSALTLESGVKNPYAIGKIVTSYYWYVVLSVSESVADKFPDEPDSRAYPVTFTENSDKIINMELYKKVSSGAGALLIFKSDVMPTDFNYLRVQNVQVTVSEYVGYRVPCDAIQTLDGRVGVYTVDSNREVHFKPIKVLYTNDAYAIVAKNDGSEDMKGYLAVNDLMVVSGKNIYEGKIIG